MHIASRWLDVHLEVEFLLMQLEAIASLARGSHGTLSLGMSSLAHLLYPFIFEENPDGTLMLARHSNMLSFSSLLRV